MNFFDAHRISVKHSARRGSIVVKGVGRFKWKFDDRYTPTRVKLARVVRLPRGVYVQLVCEVDLDVCGAEHVVGIDVGVKDRAVPSNGSCIEKAMRKVRYLKRMQRLVSQSRKGSGLSTSQVSVLSVTSSANAFRCQFRCCLGKHG